MMARALFIYRVDKSDPSNLGVIHKLHGQVQGLEAAHLSVDYIVCDRKHIYKSGQVISETSSSLISKWKFFDYIDRDLINGYDIYIIRYGLSTPSFIRFLKDLRNAAPTCKIIIDMPTYPYHQEWTGLKGAIVMRLDRWWSDHLRKYVDAILHSGPEDSIHGVSTTPFSNGVDVERVPVRQPQKDAVIRLLAFAKWREWHGLDRVIYGLRDYVKTTQRSIHLDVLGTGPTISKLRSLVLTSDINQYVSFHGVVHGETLDAFFDKADIGIGTLGLHRKGVAMDSSLKHREFMARGLPFVMAGNDRDIDSSLHYIFEVSADDSPIDLDHIVSQLEQVDAHLIKGEMRSYAEETLSWKVKMSLLMDQINTSSEEA